MRIESKRTSPMLIVLLATVAAFSVSSDAHAQIPVIEKTPAPPPDRTAVVEEATETVVPVLPSEIASQSEQTLTTLREMDAQLKSDTVVSESEKTLPETLKSLGKLEAQSISDRYYGFSLYKVIDLQSDWDRFLSQLVLWDKRLKKRSEELSGLLTKLKEHELIWKKTDETATTDELPQEVRDRILSVVNEIDRAKESHINQQKEVLKLQDQIADFRSRATEAREKLEITAGELRDRRFTLDRAPLWSIRGEEIPYTQQLQDSLHQFQKTFASFWVDYRERMVVHFGLFVLLASLMMVLKRKYMDQEIENTTVRVAQRILHHPVAAALLVSLIFTTVIYPDAPVTMLHINRLLAMLAIVVLIPAELQKRYKTTIFCFVAAYILSQTNHVFLEGSFLQRLSLLGITVLSMIVLLRLAQICYPVRDAKHIYRVAFAICCTYIFLLAVSLIANVIGAVSLAGMLAMAVISSTFGAIGLWLGAVVLIGSCWFITQMRISRMLLVIQHHSHPIHNYTQRILWFLAALAWIWGTMKFFEVYDMLHKGVSVLLGMDLMRGDVTVSVGDLLIFIFSVVVAILAARIFRFILEEEILPRISLPRGVAGGISHLTYYTIIFVGLVGAFVGSGFDYTRLAFIIGALGVGIGFGLRNLVNNFISGLIIIFQRPIQMGDSVEIGSQVGSVHRIGILSTTLRTFTGAEVIVPNGDLTSKEVVNWTLSDHVQRIDIPVQVPLKSDPHVVLDLLVKLASAHNDVLQNPQPTSFLTELGDSHLTFELRCWVNDERNYHRVRSEISTTIYSAFQEADIIETS